jgi:hypothetical protein
VNLDQLDNLPKLTIESEIWDMTWILNKTARLVERYNIEVAVSIKKSNSVTIDIAIVSLLTAFTYEFQKQFARDLYNYVKNRIIKKQTKPKLTTPTDNDQQALPQKIRYNKTIEIKISWNKEWEERGFANDKKDNKLK